MPYIQELELKGNKSQVLAFFMDPVRFTGILGHVNIVKIFDKSENKYVTMSDLKNPENKFKVIYVFGDPDSKVSYHGGIMEGPILLLNGGVEYKGETNDGKLVWKIDLLITEVGHLIKLKITADVKQNLGFFSKILGNNFDLAEHLVRDHIVPFIKFFFRPRSEDFTNVNEVFRFKGSVEEILIKLREIITNITYGGIIIIGESCEIVASIINGEILHAQINSVDVQSGDVMTYLLKLKGDMELIAYSVIIEDLIFRSIKKKLEEIKSKS